jgi:hypothetical protein
MEEKNRATLLNGNLGRNARLASVECSADQVSDAHRNHAYVAGEAISDRFRSAPWCSNARSSPPLAPRLHSGLYQRVILQIIDPAQAYAPWKSNRRTYRERFRSRLAIGREISVMARRRFFPLRSAGAFCRHWEDQWRSMDPAISLASIPRKWPINRWRTLEMNASCS